MRNTRCWTWSTMQSMPGVLGTLASSTARARHFFTRWYDREQEVHQVRSWSLLYPELLHQEGPTTWSQVRKERKLIENTTLQINSQKKCKKRQFLSIHDRFIRDTWFRKTMLELGRTEEVIREMDKLANEDHTHIATEEEVNVYRSNWWIRSNFVGSDTMPIRHRPDFKEALSTVRSPQECWGSSLLPKLVAKLFLVFVAMARFPGGIPHLRHHHDDGLDTDGAVKPAKTSDWANYSWNDSQN